MTLQLTNPHRDGDVAGPPTTHEEPLPSPTRAPARVMPHVAFGGGAIVLSLLLWAHVWFGGHPTSSITCLCGDVSEELWWLRWLPWAIGHGHNPFFSNALFAGSGGVNQLANGSAMLPALLLSPVTVLFGPVAASNVGAVVGPAVSAWCMFFLLRRLTTFVPGQVLASLLWGFSPFVMYNLPHGHLLHLLGVFPPLALAVLHDSVVTHRRSWRANGILLAALVIGQFFVSTEMLAIYAVAAGVGAIVMLLVDRRAAVSSLRELGATAGVAVGVAGAVLVYPVWFALAGPRHVSGQPWLHNAVGYAPANLVTASADPHHVPTLFQAMGYRNPVPLPTFLGWAVLAVLAASVPLWRRRALPWCALGAGIISWILSWGIPIGSTSWWPWRLLNHLPIVSAIQPGRFAAPMYFCAALLLAFSLDGWWRAIVRVTTRPAATSARWALTALLTGAGAGAMIPVASQYTVPFAVQRAGVPGAAWYLTTATRLPQGSRVLSLPDPTILPADYPMAFQAIDSFRFDLVGGYELVPGAGGRSNLVSPRPGFETLLHALTVAPVYWSEPPLSAATIREARSAIRSRKVDVTVVTAYFNTTYAVHYMTAVYGRPPEKQHGAWVWYGPPGPKPASNHFVGIRHY